MLWIVYIYSVVETFGVDCPFKSYGEGDLPQIPAALLVPLTYRTDKRSPTGAVRDVWATR